MDESECTKHKHEITLISVLALVPSDAKCIKGSTDYDPKTLVLDNVSICDYILNDAATLT